ncbi:MAG: hypothetical protein P4L85_08555 [Paludisphaera borealis]|uniref:hypothetical protein n=1 Tax=Paludisphaera borealis TaxID=1387353 RepID=UPI00284363B9|nr:hypothetical protein [Paludisphaera borealis]MDR3619386.1 hypothetical protein [Paludisphaera borealis]
MAVVGVVALIVSCLAMEDRRQHTMIARQQSALLNEAAARDYALQFLEANDPEAAKAWQAVAAYYAGLVEKYQDAASRPFSWVEPDPPNPALTAPSPL